jgi:polyhydroxyalkanoate synthase
VTSPAPGPPDAPEPVPDVATGLDMLLTDGALGPLRRLLPAASGLRMAASLAARPTTVVRRGAGFAAELAKIGLGSSEVSPHPKDKRYTHPAWSQNPVLRRAVQAHLAASGAATELVEDAELGWADHERLRFAVGNLSDALAPSNSVLNPAAWRAAVDTHGASVVRGVRNLVADLATTPRVPSMVEPDAFEVGKDLAVTPGAVVLRTPVFELIQYQPQTPRVRELPLLLVPPTINKYYVADLAPGRSIVEHLVQGGQQSSSSPGATRTPSTRRGDSTPTARRSSTRWRPVSASPAPRRRRSWRSAPAA